MPAGFLALVIQAFIPVLAQELTQKGAYSQWGFPTCNDSAYNEQVPTDVQINYFWLFFNFKRHFYRNIGQNKEHRRSYEAFQSYHYLQVCYCQLRAVLDATSFGLCKATALKLFLARNVPCSLFLPEVLILTVTCNKLLPPPSPHLTLLL